MAVIPIKPMPRRRGRAARRPLFTADAVAGAGHKPRSTREVFALHEPPPGVVPSGEPTMAQDSAITGALNWAQGSYGFLFEEGLAFLGYPYLAELAQRPEYRRLAETVASEMTREWVELKSTSDEDKSDKLTQLVDAMKRLDVQDAFRRIAEQDGFFGRAHLYIDLGTTDDRDELKTSIGGGRDQISRAKIKRGSLVAVRPVEAVWAYPTDYNSTDPLASNWYRPLTWYVMGKQIHATRLLTFIGREVPDLLKPAYSFGGLSLSQMVKPYVDNWLRTRSSVGDLVHSFSTTGISTNLAVMLQRDGEQGLFNRADFYNRMRDNRGMMLLDKDTEEFFNVSTPLGGLDALQAQSQEHICSASGLPLIKFTGLTPTGLNASSEGEIRSFYDWIAAFQKQLFRKHLVRVLDFIQLSEFGEVDPDITLTFKSLWQLDEAGKATVQQTKASIHETYESMGAIANSEVRQALIADPESPYAGLDLEPEDLPPPPAPGLSGSAQAEPGVAHEPGSTPGHTGGAAAVRSPFGGGRNPFSGHPPTAASMARGDSLVVDAGWEEGKHPRGQPGNPGQFGPGGGGAEPVRKSKEAPEAPKGVPAKEVPQASQTPASELFQKETRHEVTIERFLAALPAKTHQEIANAKARLAAGTPTDAPVSEGGHKNADGTWTESRQALHDEIIAKILTPEIVARATPEAGEKPTFTILGGRGGSGKSWLTRPGGPVDGTRAVVFDNDQIKAMIPDYQGWNAALVHEEASDIFNKADQLARSLGINVVHDATMKTPANSEAFTKAYAENGYRVDGYYMFLPPEVAAERALERFSRGGRFVPPEYVMSSRSNEKSFDTIKGSFGKWAVYNNNVPRGMEPQLVASSGH